ncbi:hypothetical protein ABPG77_007103 [Micractinium sp. CCAP 211/92]
MTSEQPKLVEKPKLPAVHSAAPPRLRQGATEAFSVAQWKREALEFAQQLDSLLLRCQPAATLSGGGGCEAKIANDAAAAGDTLGWDAALALHEAAAPPLVLDASDLRLLTVQEELVRELGAEPAQQAQQAEQRQEEGPQEQQQQVAEPAPAARAGSEERSRVQQDQVEDGQAQEAAAAGQLQPAAGSAQAPGPAEPLVEPGGAPPELLLASEAPLLGLPGRHVPLVQAVPWSGGSEGAAVDAGGSGGEPATHGGPGTQQQERKERQERQPAGACGSTPQDAGQPQGGSLGSDEQQQEQEAPVSLQTEQQDQLGGGVARQQKGRQVAGPAPAPAAGTSAEPQRASPAQQEQQVEPGAQDQHASKGQQEQQTEAGAQQRHATPPEQQAAPAERQAAAKDQAQQGAAQPAEGERQQEQLAAFAGSLAGSLPLLGLQLPLLPLPLPLLSAFPLNATQEQVEQQPQGKRPRGARQRQQQQQQQQQQVEPGGRRHRKRPRWLSDMVDVAAAEQVIQQPDRAAGVELPPALPPLPAQPAQQQAAAPALPLPMTSLEAAAAFGLPAEPAGTPGVPGVPGWDAALAALFGQSQGQQALPLLPWPQLADLLQLPLVPLPAADSGAAETETETVEAAIEPDGPANQRTGGRRGGGGRGRGRGGGRRVAKGKSRARPGTVERPAFVEAAIQAAIEAKEEGDATLEAYRQRAEAARQRRLDQRQAAAQLLASIADSELVAPLQWQLLQDARSRQLQAIARATAEAALHQEAGTGGGAIAQRVGAGEVVLQVALHVPQAPQFISQEWLVLGSQKLTELQDSLFCVADDNIAAVEKEENAHLARNGQPLLQLRKPSAYFYIEGTFYNDLRHPQAEDYSAPIRQYNRKEGIPAPPHPVPGSTRTDVTTTEFTTARMQDASFESLWLRLGSGAGYLYCHQGGCEHLLTFQDVRIFDPSCDPPLRQHYPFRLTAPQHTIIRDCEVCGTRAAKRVTYDDRAAPHTPFFWCEDCFRLMHYDEQGSALYTDFRVFPYVQEYPVSIMASKQKSGGARTRAASAAVAATEQG